jgi:hypothetical protein
MATIFITVCYLMFFAFSGGIRVAVQMVSSTSPIYQVRLAAIKDFYEVTSYARILTVLLVFGLLTAFALRKKG